MELFIQLFVYFLLVFMFGFDYWLSMLNYNNRNATIPEEVNDIYNEEDYKKWLNYTMEKYRFSKILSVVNTVVFLLMLAFGIFVIFDDLAKVWFSNNTTQVVAFFGFYYVVTFIIGFYPSYYHTFTIEEKYGFNKSTKKTFYLDKIKGVILTAVLGGGLVVLVYSLWDNLGDAFIYATWGAIILIILVVNMIYTTVIVPIFNQLTPLEDGELKDAINVFANSVGYEVSKISVMDASKRSSKLNAFFSGFGKFKKIVLYDTLIEKMTTEEIVAVLAHEIGHNKYKHVVFNLIQTAITMFIYIGLFGLLLKTDVMSTAFGFDSSNFGFSVILFSVIIGPLALVINLISAQFSRKHEYQADSFAATKYSKEHMESALKVLAKENFANLTPHPLYVKLTYSHPPIVDRIRAIRSL